MNISLSLSIRNILIALILSLGTASSLWIFWPHLTPYVWILFYPAILLSAWIGGLYCGLTATAACTALGWFSFRAAQPEFPADHVASWAPGAVFVTTSVLFTFLLSRFRLAILESRANAARLDAVLERTGTGYWDWDIASGHVDYSPAWARILGEASVTAHYQTWISRVHPDDWPGVEQSLRQHLSDPDSLWQREHRLRTASGGWKWVIGRGQVVAHDARGHPLRMVGTMNDIVERKALEREVLFKTEVLENAFNGLAISDAELRLIYVNRSFIEMWGYASSEELLGQAGDRLCADPSLVHRVAGRLEAGTSELLEMTARRKDGTTFPALVSVQRRRDADGREYFCTSSIDITALKQAEQSAQEAAVKLQIVAQAANVGFWEFNLQTGTVFYSTEWKSQLGYSDQEIENAQHEWVDRLHPDDRAKVLSLRDRNIANAVDYCEYEFRLRHKNGSYRWILSQVHQIRDEEGQLVQMLGVHLDITQRKDMEDSLRQSEERLRRSQLYGGIGTWEYDPATKQEVWSDTVTRLLGFPDLQHPTFDDYLAALHPEDRPSVIGAIERHLQHDEALDVEYRIVTPQREIRWMRSAGQAERNAAGDVLRVRGIVQDITDRKAAELALRAADRGKDEFLAMLAHELRNPLAAISNVSAILNQGPMRAAPEPWLLQILDRQLTQLAHLVDDLLDIARLTQGKIALELECLELSPLVAECLETLQPAISRADQHPMLLT